MNINLKKLSLQTLKLTVSNCQQNGDVLVWQWTGRSTKSNVYSKNFL